MMNIITKLINIFYFHLCKMSRLHYPLDVPLKDIFAERDRVKNLVSLETVKLPDTSYAKQRVHFSLDDYFEILEMYDEGELYQYLDYYNISIDRFVNELGHYPIFMDRMIDVMEALDIAFNFSQNPADNSDRLENYLLQYNIDIQLDNRLFQYPMYQLFFLITRGYYVPDSDLEIKYMTLRGNYPDYCNIIDAAMRKMSVEKFDLLSEAIQIINKIGTEEFGKQYLQTDQPYWTYMDEYLNFLKLSQGKLVIIHNNLSDKIPSDRESMFEHMMRLTDYQLHELATQMGHKLARLDSHRSRRSWVDGIRVQLKHNFIGPMVDKLIPKLDKMEVKS